MHWEHVGRGRGEVDARVVTYASRDGQHAGQGSWTAACQCRATTLVDASAAEGPVESYPQRMSS